MNAVSEEKKMELCKRALIIYALKKDKMMGRLHTAYNNLCRLGMRGEVSKKIEHYKMKISEIDYRKESYEDGVKQLEELEKRILEDIPKFYSQTHFK